MRSESPQNEETIPMSDYKAAFSQIRANPDLAKKFVNDPKGTLEGLGVKTANLSTAQGGKSAQNGVCIGCGICVG
jgi:ferredoxin